MTYPRIVIIIMLAFIAGLDAVAQVKLGKTESGNASYYAPRFNGKRTSFGEIHKSTELLAAHRSYPLNTMLEITNLDNDEKVIVRVNDRGPFSKHRVVDLSKEAARLLGILAKGVANVTVRVVGMEGMVLLESNEEIDPKSGKVVAMRARH